MEPVVCLLIVATGEKTERMGAGSEESVKFSLKHKKLAFIFNVSLVVIRVCSLV